MRDKVVVGGTELEFVGGDSLEFMASMEEGSVDVIATSPPYNLGIKYGEGVDDGRSRSDYLGWTAAWLDAAWRVLSPRGSLFLNMGSKPTNPLGPEQVLLVAVDPTLIGSGRRTPAFFLQNKFCWAKSVTVRVKARKETIHAAAAKAGLTVGQARALLRAIREVEGEKGEERTVGHAKHIQSDRFVNDTWEVVYHLTKSCDVDVDRLAKGLGVPYEDKANLSRWKEARERGDLRCRGSVWMVPYETIQSREEDRGGHPATFPQRLAELCFLLHGKDRIRLSLDPFSGIGSSSAAAAKVGVPRHVGVEKVRDNHLEAVRRARELATGGPSSA